MKKSSHTSYHTIQFHETDMAGFAHFPQVFLWAEKAELEFMKTIEHPLIEIKTNSIKAWPRVHVEADYYNVLRFQDDIAICIHIEAIGKHSITYNIGIYKQEKDQWTRAARVKMKTLYAEGSGPSLPLKKQPIPEEILKKITTAKEPTPPPSPSR